MKRAVTTTGAPEAIGPYSQAVSTGDWLFLSGQIPLDPASGELVVGGFEVEARRVFANVAAVLSAEGLGFDDVVKVTVYLTDLGDFAALNSIYAEHFSAPYPARVTVGVAALPKGASVELEVTARTAAS